MAKHTAACQAMLTWTWHPCRAGRASKLRFHTALLPAFSTMQGRKQAASCADSCRSCASTASSNAFVSSSTCLAVTRPRRKLRDAECSVSACLPHDDMPSHVHSQVLRSPGAMH